MKRSCRMIIVLCLPLLFCGQVMAQHSGPYLGAFLGGNALASSKGSDDLGEFRITFKPALQGSAVLGWDFESGNPAGEGRVELEYSRRSNSLDKLSFVEGRFEGSGTLTADSLLVNSFAVFHDNSRWAPYVGVGLGAARIVASDLTVAGRPLGSGSVTVFAYQAGSGIDVALTNRLNLDLGYRFFGTARPAFTETGGRTFRMDYFSHCAVIGLRAGF